MDLSMMIGLMHSYHEFLKYGTAINPTKGWCGYIYCSGIGRRTVIVLGLDLDSKVHSGKPIQFFNSNTNKTS